MKQFMREYIRPVGLTILAPGAGFLLLFLIELSLKIEVSRLLSSVVNLIIASLIAFLIFSTPLRKQGLPATTSRSLPGVKNPFQLQAR